MEAGAGNHERLVECRRRPDAVLGHRGLGRERQGAWRLSRPLHCIPGGPSPHGPGPASLLGMTGGKKYHTAWGVNTGLAASFVGPSANVWGSLFKNY